jgi:hypothetical protein
MEGLIDLQSVHVERRSSDAIEIGDGNSLDFLRAVYRNVNLPLSTRMRAAQAALVHEVPRLAVTAVVTNQEDFAQRLDKCIARARETRMLPGPVIEHQPNGQLRRRV